MHIYSHVSLTWVQRQAFEAITPIPSYICYTFLMKTDINKDFAFISCVVRHLKERIIYDVYTQSCVY